MAQYEAVDLLVNQEVIGTCILMTSYGILNVQKSNFTNLNANCLASRQSKLEVKDVIFNNSEIVAKNPNYWDQYNAGVAWVSIYEANPGAAQIVIERVNFYFGGGVSELGAGINIRSINSLDITIKDSNFTNLQAKYGGAIYTYISVGSLTVQNCVFANNIAKKDGGALYVKGKSSNSISFFRNQLISLSIFNNQAGSNGGGVFVHTTNLDMDKVTILKNRAFNGGGIYLNNHIKAVQISPLAKDQFRDIQLVNNVASGLGPAIKLNFNLTEYFATPVGSLVWIDGNKIDLTALNITNRTWALDQISIHKPTYFQVRMFKILSVEQTTTTTDFKALISNSNHSVLESSFYSDNIPTNIELLIKSGHKLPMLLELTVLDQDKNIMVTVNDERVDFTLELDDPNDKTTKIVAFSDTFQKGLLYVKDQIELIGKKGAKGTLRIKSRNDENSPLLKDLGAVLDIPIKILFQPCEQGDIYNPNTLQCITCAPGTYSFADPYDQQASCMECVENADCLRGSMVPPKPGYYRYDINTLNFRKCEVDDSCLGGVVDNIYHPQGKCKDPYYGNLCSQCDFQSAKFGGAGQCHSCVNDWTYYLKFFLLFAASIITILLTIWLNLRRAVLMKIALDTNDDEKKEIVKQSAFNAVVLKIAINFTLTKEVIADYGFKWPTFVSSTMSFMLNMLPTAEEGFSIDCFIVLITDDYDRVFYIKLISKILKPVTYWCLFVGLYFLFRKCFYRHSKLTQAEIKDRIILILLAIAYMSQTEIITSCLQLFKCSNFSNEADPKYFLDANPQIQCFTTAHMRWGLGFGITFFILWGIVFPLILYFKIKEVAHDPYKRLRYSFIFAGMRNEKYYWEFIVLLRKEVMVLILVFLRAFKVGGQIFLSLFALCYFTYLQLSRKPFNDKRLNDLEFYSLISCIIMLVVGYFFHIQDKTGSSTASYVLSSIAVLSNLIFYILLAFNIIQSIRRNMKRVVKAVKNKVISHYKLGGVNSEASQKSIADCDNAPTPVNANSSIQKNDDNSSSNIFLLANKDNQTSAATLQELTLQSQKTNEPTNLSLTQLNSMEHITKKKSLFGRALEIETRKSAHDVKEDECIDFDVMQVESPSKDDIQEINYSKVSEVPDEISKDDDLFSCNLDANEVNIEQNEKQSLREIEEPIKQNSRNRANSE